MALSTEDNRAWTGTRYKCGSMSQLVSLTIAWPFNAKVSEIINFFYYFCM